MRSGLTFLKDLYGRAWNSGEKSGFQARIDTSQHLLRILSPQRLKRCIGKDLNYDMDKYMKALSSVADEIRLGLRNTDASFDGVGRLANFMTLFVAQDADKLDTFLLFKLDWREVGRLSFMDFLPSTRGRFNPAIMLGSTLAARQDMERALRYYADALMVIFGGGQSYNIALEPILALLGQQSIESITDSYIFYAINMNLAYMQELFRTGEDHAHPLDKPDSMFRELGSAVGKMVKMIPIGANSDLYMINHYNNVIYPAIVWGKEQEMASKMGSGNVVSPQNESKAARNKRKREVKKLATKTSKNNQPSTPKSPGPLGSSTPPSKANTPNKAARTTTKMCAFFAMGHWGVTSSKTKEPFKCNSGSACWRSHLTDYKGITRDEAREAGGDIYGGVLASYLAAIEAKPQGFFKQ